MPVLKKPIFPQLTVRFDADIVDWFKKQARVGCAEERSASVELFIRANVE